MAPVSPAAPPGPSPAPAPSCPAAAPVRPAASPLAPPAAASPAVSGGPGKRRANSAPRQAARSDPPPAGPAALTGSALVVAPPLLRLGHGRSGAQLGSAPAAPLRVSVSPLPPARVSATISRWKSRIAFYSNASARPTSRAGAAEVIGESRRRTNRRRRQKSP